LIPRPAVQPPLELTLETAPAEVGRFDLPDGSRLVLGAASKAAVSYSDTERRLALLAGEAFVTVQPSTDRPFLVIAEGLIAKATGTAYEVRERHDGILVAVSKGHVSVYPSTNGLNLRRLHPGERVVATPTEDGPMRIGQVEAIPIEQVGAWKNHQLVYQAATLADVISDVNRYSAIPIEIVDPPLASLRISATFEGTNPGFVLEALSEAFPLAVDRRDPEKIRLIAL
ncbi:MAG: FecR domain-containing protein, partial [Pseudomonadota bacterium]